MLIFTCMTCPIFRTIRIKREKKVGKMSRLLRCCAYYFAFVLVLTFGSNAFAAGYTCPTYKKYTSCNANYYVSNCGSSSNWTGQTIASSALTTGNSCISCPDGYTCQSTAGLVCPKKSTVTCSAGYYLSAAGACTLCKAGYKCNGQTTYTPNGSIQGRTACSGTAEYQNATGQTTCKAVSDGYYKNGNTAQQACGTGYFCKSGVRTACTTYGTGYTTGTTTASVNTQCYLSVAAGKVRSGTTGTTLSTCAAGTYKAAHNAYYGTTYTCSACTGRTQYSAAGAGACSTVGSGYYTTRCNTSNNNCTGQSQCTSGTYCASGVQNQCPTADSGWTKASPAGSTAYTACYEYQTPANCASGSVKRAASSTTAYSSTIALNSTLKSNAGYYASTTATSCTICPAGSSCAAGATAPSTCANWTYSSAGASSCTSCPTLTSGWSKQNSTGTGWTSVSSCVQVSGTPSNCASGNLKQTATSSTAWGSSAVNTALSANAGYYVNGTACTQCQAGYYCTGGTAARAACSALTGVSPTGGTYTSAAGSSAKTACKYTAPAKTITGCATVTPNQVTYSGTAWPASTYNVTANAGYVIAGNGTASATCNACTSGGYSTGGTATSCSLCSALTAKPATTDGTYSSVSPFNAATTCRYTAKAKTITGCSAVTNNTVSYDGSKWGTNLYSVTANGGYIIANNNSATATCTQCANWTYSAGGTATACSNCPTVESGWTKATGAGWSELANCKETKTGSAISSYCSAGVLTKTASSATAWGSASITTALQAAAGSIVSGQTCTQCGAGKYSAGGTATSCGSCPAAETGWTMSTATGLSAVTACTETTTPATSGSPIATICTAGTLTKKATSTTAWGSATASGLTAKAGRYVNGTTCSACAAGTYTSAATTATSCTAAAKGYYVSGTEQTAQSACAAGTYTSSTGQSKCTDAAAGTYTTGCQITASNTACTGTSVCATNTWSNAKASSCTACTTAKGYGNSGTTAASHAGIASCKVTCGGGKYVATAGAGCVDVGIGYWGAGGTVAENATLARNQCASGLTTIGTGAGADEAADCGRVLNFNGQKIYLRSEKRTTPSLNISINGTTFYGNMTEGTSKGSLRINSGGTVYSVHDDSM